MNVHGQPPFIRSVQLLRERIDDFDQYPFSIPALRHLEELQLGPGVTFLVGDNGSGKSTLLEAIAVACGLNAEGGSPNFRFSTRRSESDLHRYLRISRTPRRPRNSFFFRAESYFNLATEIERLDAEPEGGAKIIGYYGGVSLHEQSHGESFLALAMNKFEQPGLFLLDEPEAALSPQRQLSLLSLIAQSVAGGSQFVVATHSPILMACPQAWLFQLDSRGIYRTEYEDTEHFRVTRDFLTQYRTYLRFLLE